jgi:hypothetical protein
LKPQDHITSKRPQDLITLKPQKTSKPQKNMDPNKGRIIELPKIVDPRGNLTVAEQMKNIPFNIERVYWTYDIPGGERRGGHAHRSCEEIIIAVSGSFDVEIFDGKEKKTYHLNHPYQGLYVGTDVWRTLEDFASGSVCLVLASELFDEEEYIYDYDEFLERVGCTK